MLNYCKSGIHHIEFLNGWLVLTWQDTEWQKITQTNVSAYNSFNNNRNQNEIVDRQSTDLWLTGKLEVFKVVTLCFYAEGKYFNKVLSNRP